MGIKEIEEVVKEFTEADNAIRKIYSKVDPLLVVRLISDSKKAKSTFTLLKQSLNQARILKKSETE